LQKIQVENKTQEAIKLVYADNDIVYVSIHSHAKSQNIPVRRTPKIYKLGSNAWKVLKQKNEGKVKNIAFNLIQLYAKKVITVSPDCALCRGGAPGQPTYAVVWQAGLKQVLQF
jgi:transcription-repair coupling factor (superfamily II helicase)